MADTHYYLRGPPAMIDAALLQFSAAAVPIENIHYDKFLDARQLNQNEPDPNVALTGGALL